LKILSQSPYQPANITKLFEIFEPISALFRLLFGYRPCGNFLRPTKKRNVFDVLQNFLFATNFRIERYHNFSTQKTKI